LSGITFAISYYSEVLRLCVCYVDVRNRFVPNNSTWVKCHRGDRSRLNTLAGIPVCLPKGIKELLQRVRVGLAQGSLSRVDLILYKLVLTALSFFRATSPNYSVIKKSTITGSFTGSCETLPIKEIESALKSLGWDGIRGSLFKSKPNMLQ